MRYIRMLFVAVVAIALLTLALANRQMVQVRAFPGQLDAYLGGNWSLNMPLFLVIILSLLVGMVLGLVWEWLREAHLRQESSRRALELTRLEREVGGLRTTHKAPRDEVLAILDGPRPAAGSTTTVVTTNLPAQR